MPVDDALNSVGQPCNATSMDKTVHVFTYHPPTEETIPKYNAIREAGLAFAKVIEANAPPSPDRTVAIRKIREAVMTANAAIACGGIS